MSIESAKAFLEKVRNDEDFRNSVGKIATAEERTEYVKGAGFDFTMEEMDTVKSELGVNQDCWRVRQPATSDSFESRSHPTNRLLSKLVMQA
ncbi:MAG: Nif11-like leader peptide family natural product precursor [Deltaproteobacteria bacterium]|jgi:predicted ribosomally synthesized peptide with nif11-like leader|nr:Nif11-like leader peptide family natural product precursor [Deltaproteobacteria bacterium]